MKRVDVLGFKESKCWIRLPISINCWNTQVKEQTLVFNEKSETPLDLNLNIRGC